MKQKMRIEYVSKLVGFAQNRPALEVAPGVYEPGATTTTVSCDGAAFVFTGGATKFETEDVALDGEVAGHIVKVTVEILPITKDALS